MPVKNLNKILSEKRSKKGDLIATVPFSDGITVDLEYADPAEIRRMLRRAKKTEWIRHQKTETYDDFLYNQQIADKIKGWSGLTLGKLADLVAIDVDEKDADAEIEFNAENVAAMLDQAPGFSVFVSRTIMDLAVFRAQQQAGRVKNSKPSPASSSD